MENGFHRNPDPAEELFLRKLDQILEEQHSDEQFGAPSLPATW